MSVFSDLGSDGEDVLDCLVGLEFRTEDNWIRMLS
jgi:hypothetical protein